MELEWILEFYRPLFAIRLKRNEGLHNCSVNEVSVLQFHLNHLPSQTSSYRFAILPKILDLDLHFAGGWISTAT